MDQTLKDTGDKLEDLVKKAEDLLEKGKASEAMQLYRAAADRGSAPAQYMLGKMYFTGRGVNCPMYQAAFTWFKQAASQGFVDAQFNLGAMYSEGQGVDRNDVESCKWFLVVVAKGDKSLVGAANGDKKSAEILNNVADDLNEEEQTTAKRLANEVLAREGHSGAADRIKLPKPSPTSWRDKTRLEFVMEFTNKRKRTLRRRKLALLFFGLLIVTVGGSIVYGLFRSFLALFHWLF